MCGQHLAAGLGKHHDFLQSQTETNSFYFLQVNNLPLAPLHPFPTCLISQIIHEGDPVALSNLARKYQQEGQLSDYCQREDTSEMCFFILLPR